MARTPRRTSRKKGSRRVEQEADEWEWADNIPDENFDPGRAKKPPPPTVHTSVRLKGSKTSFEIGDLIQFNGSDTRLWIGMARGFRTRYSREEGILWEVYAQWFNKQHDVGHKLRIEAAPEAEIYFGVCGDWADVTSIVRHVFVCSSKQEWEARTKRTKNVHPDRTGIYYCASGVDSRKGIWIPLVWKDWYDYGNTDFDKLDDYLIDYVEKNDKRKNKRQATKVVRKRKNSADQNFLGESEDEEKEAGEEEEEEEEEEENQRPVKKLKTQSAPVTPNKKSASTFTTPTTTRVKKPLQVTPLPLRQQPSNSLDSPYKLAQANLHVSAVPMSLPCREEEYNTILEQLETAIDEGTGACIYVSGVPGTGKTATVREVIRTLQERVDAEELDDFQFLEINGLKVLDPNQAFAMLWEALTGERVTPAHAANLLESKFKAAGPGRVPCVVLLDELDQLVTGRQTVLYNLFNWPTLPNSRLIVVAIANTMNLADLLPNKIQSRVGLTRVNFEPYTSQQLITIIESRLRDVPGKIFEQGAIKLCATRIANNTGDARKALDICRRAVEVAEEASDPTGTPTKKGAKKTEETKGIVTTNLINDVIQEFVRHPIQKALRNVCFAGKLFLAALLLRNRRLSGKADLTFGDVIEEAVRICMSSVGNSNATSLMRGVTTPRGLENAAVELDVFKVIGWEEKGGRRGGRVGLQITEDELTMAFQNDDEWKKLLK